MDTLVLFVLLLLGLSAYVAWPLYQARFERGALNHRGGNHHAADLVERKQTLYEHIKDIELDYQMGKLSDEDFRQLRDQYKAEAARLLQQIEQLRYRPRSRKAKGVVPQDQAGPNFCWMCGTRVEGAQQFCSNCGNPLH